MRHTYIIVTAGVNRWGAPNKKRDSLSSAALTQIVERDMKTPMRISE